MNKKHLIYPIVITLLFVNGCRITEEITPEPDMPEYEHEMVNLLKQNEAKFDKFEARFTGNFSWGGQNHNISGTLRIKNNEKIYMSLSPILGIEVARIIVKPDKIKYLNRIESNYYIGSIDYLNSTLRTSLNYDILQAILTGNDINGYNNKSFKNVSDNNVIKLHDPERTTKKSDRNSYMIDNLLFLDKETYKITKNHITEKNSGRSIKAQYYKFDKIEDELFPTKINLSISDSGYNANLLLEYVRININKPFEINFSVPSRYKPIDF